MKIIFEFDTTNPDFYDCNENDKLYRMQNADEMASCLSDLAEKIRSLVKWDEREQISKDEIEETFWGVVKDHHLDFDRMGY